VNIPFGFEPESDKVELCAGSSPGATVKNGEAPLEVETDKVNVEVEAPEDGTLGEFGAKVGAVIAVIEK
jgi:pyruvate/2-oxoglutarate dehydrogenase complex dihydrolipoamide acyltransferase (E2) component